MKQITALAQALRERLQQSGVSEDKINEIGRYLENAVEKDVREAMEKALATHSNLDPIRYSRAAQSVFDQATQPAFSGKGTHFQQAFREVIEKFSKASGLMSIAAVGITALLAQNDAKAAEYAADTLVDQVQGSNLSDLQKQSIYAIASGLKASKDASLANLLAGLLGADPANVGEDVSIALLNAAAADVPSSFIPQELLEEYQRLRTEFGTAETELRDDKRAVGHAMKRFGESIDSIQSNLDDLKKAGTISINDYNDSIKILNKLKNQASSAVTTIMESRGEQLNEAREAWGSLQSPYQNAELHSRELVNALKTAQADLKKMHDDFENKKKNYKQPQAMASLEITDEPSPGGSIPRKPREQANSIA